MTKLEELYSSANGEGCLGRSQDDEPVFILCGRDPVAGGIIREWADRREVLAKRLGILDGREREKIAEARRYALRVDAWPKNIKFAVAAQDGTP